MSSNAPAFIKTSEQVSCILSGEATILNLKNQTYYGLDRVGTKIWELLAEVRTAPEIVAALVQQFEVEPESCEADVLELLQHLERAGLVDVRYEMSAPTNTALG